MHTIRLVTAAASGWYLPRQPLWLVALFGTLTSTIFLAMALAAAARYVLKSSKARKRALAVPLQSLPAVSILKPLHGMEPRLEQNLESFFRQQYPNFEIVFGVRSADDGALPTVEKLCARYPQVHVRTVLTGQPPWPNAKVFSLSQMIASSPHSYYVISDSDVLVAPDLLRNIMPPLLSPKVGLVTCLFRGVPAPGLWSHLEALGMSVETNSGAMVVDMLEGMKFALGAVMAVRSDALEAIGGIGETADFYSDDFVLGNRIAEAGYEVILSHYQVDHVLTSRSLQRTFGDQLRWMKSTRFSRPKGHTGSGLAYAVPFGLLGLLAGLGHAMTTNLGFGLLAAAWLNRMVLALAVGWSIMRDPRALWLCWMYPLQDLLGFCAWVASFGGRTFYWRGEEYRFGEEGRITPSHRTAMTSERMPAAND